jgi:hypothetical protein
MKTERLVTVYDLTDTTSRTEYEELINTDPKKNRIVNETEYPMGDGSVLRVVDHVRVVPSPTAEPEFVYKAPIC